MTYWGHTYDGEWCEAPVCKGPCPFPTPVIHKPPKELCHHPEEMVTDSTGPPCDPHPCRVCSRCGLTLTTVSA